MTDAQRAAFKIAAEVVREHFFSPDATAATRELSLTLTTDIGRFLHVIDRIAAKS